jgi:hypothetical protein
MGRIGALARLTHDHGARMRGVTSSVPRQCGTIRNVPVVIVIVALVVLAVVVYVATGRGGELSVENNDYAPLDLGPVSATDVVLLRPPTALWGYSVQATDEALERIAESIRDRDVRIVALEQLVTDLSRDHAPQPLSSPPYTAARHRREELTTPDLPPVLPVWPEAPYTPVQPEAPYASTPPEAPYTPVQPEAQFDAVAQFDPVAPAATQFTPVPPTTQFTPVGQEAPVTPLRQAARESRGDEEAGVPEAEGTGEGTAEGPGERQRERGVSGGGIPPEQSHG